MSRSKSKNIFNSLSVSTYKGVAGVYVVDSGIEGPTLGISAMTHGNEPSGLAALQFVLDNKDKLKCGRVILMINNIEAAEKYFASTDAEESRKARFVDINMNRLPEDVLTTNLVGYEIDRAKELFPIWQELDVGFDIHSTSQKSEPMIIEIKGQYEKLCEGFPIEKVIRNISKVQIGRPACDYYGGEKGIPVFEIETGSHEDEKSFEIAEISTRILLENLGVLDREESNTRTLSRDVYDVYGSVIFPDESYELVRVFSMFEEVLEGAILATGNGKDIKLNQNSQILFCSKVTKPSSIAEEVVFLTTKEN